MVARAAELGMKAMALTDVNGVYGMVRFQKACRLHGLQPIVGAEVTIDGAPLVLLARSSRGYGNLCRLLTRSHMTSREEPSSTFSDLEEFADDLVCLSGGRESRLYRLVAQGERREAERWADRLRATFGDRFHIELVHTLLPGDSGRAERLRELARRMTIGVVAGGDIHYARRDDYRRHDLLTCIRLGITVYEHHSERPVNAEAHLRSERTLRRLLPWPEAFEATDHIAADCHVDLIPGYLTPPGAELPEGVTPHDRLLELCIESLLKRYGPVRQEDALRQLRREIDVIGSLDLQEFFLVVHEVVEESRRRRIRCAGRGSAANSIVAYLLGITAVDPLAHNLLFERFLHGGRKGTPDIDVDFDAERREEIITWMEDRFGMEQTAMTATTITYGLRMALRETAKALGWPLPLIDRLTLAVPSDRPRNVEEYRDRLAAVLGESHLFNVLMTSVASLNGCPRHLGLHSGGMILSRQPLWSFTPIQVSANGVKEAQFDKNDVEAMGLVKLDVLGLRMLATLSEGVELVERHEGPCAVDEVPLDDPKVYEMIQTSQTLGLFQIESQGQMHLIAQHRPSVFNDLISEVALFRPGPLQGGMVHPFVRRRRGLEKVTYEHPDLEPILRDTYGVILFQEQVLEVAHRFAGMPIEEADDFRALMSKFRDRKEMEGMRERFVNGAVARGIPPDIANSVFDKVSNFVGYGFCRSHAAAFARTVYQSAWMKLYYPAAYMAAVMQHRPGMYNLTTLEEEARRIGVPILLPDVNRSHVRYDLERMENGRLAIRKPLTSVTALSADVAKGIVMERMRRPYASVEDLYQRVEIDRDALEWLARSGGLDRLAGSSRRALWMIGLLARRLGATGVQRPSSLLDLPAVEEADIPALPPLKELDRLRWDYLSQGSARRHPMTLVRRAMNDLEVRAIEVCRRFPAARATPTLTIGGIVILRQMPPTAKGTMFITLEDETGYIQCVARPDVRERLGDLLTRPALIVRGRLHQQGEYWRGFMVVDAWDLTGTIGGYSGYASAYGGTDRLHVEGAPGTTTPEPSTLEPHTSNEEQPNVIIPKQRKRIMGFFDHLAKGEEEMRSASR